MARMRIGDMLVKAGLIDGLQLNAALSAQRQWGGKLGDILVDQGFLDEMMLWLGLSKQLDVPLVSLPDLVIPPDVLPLLPADMCEKLDIFPVMRDERTLTVATSDPNNIGALDDVAFRTGIKVKTVLAPQREITWAIRAYYHGERQPCPPPKARRTAAAPTEPAMQVQSEAQLRMQVMQGQQPQQPQQPPGTHGMNRAATPLAELAGGGFHPSFTPQSAAPALNPSFTPTNATPAFNPAGFSQPPRTPAPGGIAPPVGWNGQAPPSLEEQLRQANEMLVTLVELCVSRGLFTREELWARMNQRR